MLVGIYPDCAAILRHSSNVDMSRWTKNKLKSMWTMKAKRIKEHPACGLPCQKPQMIRNWTHISFSTGTRSCWNGKTKNLPLGGCGFALTRKRQKLQCDNASPQGLGARTKEGGDEIMLGGRGEAHRPQFQKNMRAVGSRHGHERNAMQPHFGWKSASMIVRYSRNSDYLKQTAAAKLDLECRDSRTSAQVGTNRLYKKTNR